MYWKYEIERKAVSERAFCTRGTDPPKIAVVGWRDRDWARFSDAERRAFYETGGGQAGRLKPLDN